MSGGTGEVTLEARSKVNLGLAVLARRGDGYHQVETIMARLALADTISLRLGAAGAALDAGSASTDPSNRAAEPSAASVDLRVNVAADVATDAAAGGPAATLPPAVDNLVVRAASAYLGAWSRLTATPPPALEVTLTKRVPLAAGLGGGSADAAATLRGLQQLLPAAIDILGLAAELGSDVPFFAADLPAALARGRGERLDQLELPPAWLVLAKPPLAVTAAEAYSQLVGFTPRLKHQAAIDALAAGLEPGWRNALQAGVMRAHPVVREVVGFLRAAGLRGCLMSGSGPTCFGVAVDEAEALAVAAALRAAQPHLWVGSTHLA